jgi:hypothetical protein
MEDWFTLPARSSTIRRHAVVVDDAEEVDLLCSFKPKKSFGELSIDLLNVKTREDLAELLAQCGYVPLQNIDLLAELSSKAKSMESDRRFHWNPRRDITDPVWEHWLQLRDVSRGSLPEYLKNLPNDERKKFQVRNLMDLDGLRFFPVTDESDRLAVEIEAADPVTAIGLGAEEATLRGLGVVRCRFRRCGRFFPMPTGRGHALLYCPTERREPTISGNLPKSRCYEKEKKAREQECRFTQNMKWAKAGEARWKKLSKATRVNLSRSKFIAEHAFTISKKKKPPFTGLFVTRYLPTKERMR